MPLSRFGDLVIDLDKVLFARWETEDGEQNTLTVVFDGGGTVVIRGDAAFGVGGSLDDEDEAGPREGGPLTTRRDSLLAGVAVVETLRSHPEGMTRTQINRTCFGGHKPADELKRILGHLADLGQITTAGMEPGAPAPDRGAVWTIKDVPTT